MNQTAHNAVEQAWSLTVKARALCPYADHSAIGTTGYASPPWYRARDTVYFVNLAEPLSETDVRELITIGDFINRSFVISMAAILEVHGVVPYGANPDCSRSGGEHAQLTKWLRNHFAHGEWTYDPSKSKHVRTRQLLVKLFPHICSKAPGFVTSIDGVLEPLKDEVLTFICTAN